MLPIQRPRNATLDHLETGEAVIVIRSDFKSLRNTQKLHSVSEGTVCVEMVARGTNGRSQHN